MIYNQKVIVSESKSPSQLFKNQKIINRARQLSSTQSKNVERPFYNKLPLNFLHSPSEYNRLLITNGRTVDQGKIVKDGTITNLEYHNIPIFAAQLDSKMEGRLNKMKRMDESRQLVNTSLTACVCCCCDQYCSICAGTNVVCLQRSWTDLRSQSQTTKVPCRLSKEKERKRKNRLREQQLKKLESQMSNCFSNPSESQSSKTPKRLSKTIWDNLRKHQKIELKQKADLEILQQLKRQQQQYVKNRNLEIRKLNKSKSKSRPRTCSAKKTKKQIRQQYWDEIKESVFVQLKKKTPVFRQKPEGSELIKASRCTITNMQINRLRLIRQREAYARINKRMREEIERRMKVTRNLSHLQYKRLQKLHQCKKNQFKPTAEMINNAFTDIVHIVDQKNVLPANLNQKNIKSRQPVPVSRK